MAIADVVWDSPALIVIACVVAVFVYSKLAKRKKYSTKHYQCIPLLTEREQDFSGGSKRRCAMTWLLLPGGVWGVYQGQGHGVDRQEPRPACGRPQPVRLLAVRQETQARGVGGGR